MTKSNKPNNKDHSNRNKKGGKSYQNNGHRRKSPGSPRGYKPTESTHNSKPPKSGTGVSKD